MRSKLMRTLFPDPPKAKVPSQGDGSMHPYALYVLPDDPLRDTTEKAQVYYQKIEMMLVTRTRRCPRCDSTAPKTCNDEWHDREAALKVLGVSAEAKDLWDVVDA